MMHRQLASLAFVVALAPAVAAAQDWKEFNSQDCRCSASFPGTPQPKTQSMQTKVGTLEAKMFMLEMPTAFYAMAYVDYPKDALGKKAPDELLDGARDGAVGNVKGKLATETKISMNGYPGRELRIDAPGDLSLVARIYMAKERLYQILVVMPKAKPAGADAAAKEAAEAKTKESEAEAKKFLDSFKFGKP